MDTLLRETTQNYCYLPSVENSALKGKNSVNVSTLKGKNLLPLEGIFFLFLERLSMQEGKQKATKLSPRKKLSENLLSVYFSLKHQGPVVQSITYLNVGEVARRK